MTKVVRLMRLPTSNEIVPLWNDKPAPKVTNSFTSPIVEGIDPVPYKFAAFKVRNDGWYAPKNVRKIRNV